MSLICTYADFDYVLHAIIIALHLSLSSDFIIIAQFTQNVLGS
jgi:hypothetical protein